MSRCALLLPPGPLALDRLAPRIDATYVRPDGTAQALGVTRPVAVHVLEVVELFLGHPARRRVRVRGERERNAVAPTPADLGGEQLRIDLVLVGLQEGLEADDVLLHHLEDAEAPVAPELVRARELVAVGVLGENEEPRLARLLVIGGHRLRTAEDRRCHGDAVGVPEVRLRDGDRLAVDRLHHGGAVMVPEDLEGVLRFEERGQPAAVVLSHLRGQGVKRDHHVVVARSEAAYPVLGPAVAIVTESSGPRRRTLDEGVERSGGGRWNAIRHAHRHQPGPRDADVEAVVRLPPR